PSIHFQSVSGTHCHCVTTLADSEQPRCRVGSVARLYVPRTTLCSGPSSTSAWLHVKCVGGRDYRTTFDKINSTWRSNSEILCARRGNVDMDGAVFRSETDK